MKLKVENVEKFRKVIESCENPVYLTDNEVNRYGEYNLKLNLKSHLSFYLGVAELLKEHGDWFEIHASKFDEAKLMEFIVANDQANTED